MSECEQVLQELERYCDGELPSSRAAEIDDHLRACDPCFDRREFRVRLREVVRRKCGSAELPPGLDARIRGLLGLQAQTSQPSGDE